jgi:hypothetical protein
VIDLDVVRQTVSRAMGFIRSGAPATEVARMPSVLLAVGAAEQLIAEVERLQAEVVDMRALFDLQWRRMAEATARWRAEDPGARALVMPDLGDLLQWLMGELDRAVARANLNARLAADCADERDTATERERERIADWFTAEGDQWRINNNTVAECEYDRAAQMVRDGAGDGEL